MPRSVEIFTKLLIIMVFIYHAYDFIKKGMRGILKKNMMIYRWYSIFESDNVLDELSQKEIRGTKALIFGIIYCIYGLIALMSGIYITKTYLLPF